MNFLVGLLISSVDGYYQAQKQAQSVKPIREPEIKKPLTTTERRPPVKHKTEGSREISYEKRIKGLLEKKYQRQFFKVRPAWLRNPQSNRCLELDLYCKDLKLAFEIQSSDHFEYIPFYHKTEETFRKQQQRDILKKRLCQQHGVSLFCVDTRLIHPSYTDDEIWDIIVEALEK